MKSALAEQMTCGERQFIKVFEQSVWLVVYQIPVFEKRNPVDVLPLSVFARTKCLQKFQKYHIRFAAKHYRVAVVNAFFDIIGWTGSEEQTKNIRLDIVDNFRGMQIGFYREIYRPEGIEIAVVPLYEIFELVVFVCEVVIRHLKSARFFNECRYGQLIYIRGGINHVGAARTPLCGALPSQWWRYQKSYLHI